MLRNFLIILLLTCVFSCSSDADDTLNTSNQSNDSGFYALKVGNWWVYKKFSRDNSNQTFEDTGVIDSVRITGTTEINGKTYFQLHTKTTGNESNNPIYGENGERTELVRDSLSYLIQDSGAIMFTYLDYNERVVSTNDWGNIYETSYPDEVSTTVPAGDFICAYSERYAKSPEGEQFPGLDVVNYAEGIGLVFYTYSFVTDANHVMESRLDSYLVQ
ncbi:hypothetical protein ACW5R3_04430 [Bizionia sp. KMM 8389]